MIVGFASVAFRDLSAEAVLALAATCQAEGIEWAGDRHVRPGDFRQAESIRQHMAASSLRVISYGSYYRAAEPASGAPDFRIILETALALQAPRIRVWAGSCDAERATASERKAVIDGLAAAAHLARSAGVELVLEFHGGTLANSYPAAKHLLQELVGAGIGLIWQPVSRLSVSENLAGLAELLPWVRHVHAFHAMPPQYAKLPLADGQQVWRSYWQALQHSAADACLVEFVAGHNPEQMARDMQTLRLLRQEIAGPASAKTPE